MNHRKFKSGKSLAVLLRSIAVSRKSFLDRKGSVTLSVRDVFDYEKDAGMSSNHIISSFDSQDFYSNKNTDEVTYFQHDLIFNSPISV